jgi:preprotein translocase subunit YajC
MKISAQNTHQVKSLWSAAKADEGQNESLKSRILKLDDKLQQMLLWSNICTLLACVQMVFTIARIYSGFTGKHPVLLVSTLVIIVLLFAIFLYFKWKSIAHKDGGFKKASKTHLNYQITKLNGQRKLLSGYLMAYSVVHIISGVFFWQGIHDGLTVLFKSTAPVNLIIYGLGFYFMVNFTGQKRKLEILEKRVDQLNVMEKVVQN